MPYIIYACSVKFLFQDNVCGMMINLNYNLFLRFFIQICLRLKQASVSGRKHTGRPALFVTFAALLLLTGCSGGGTDTGGGITTAPAQPVITSTTSATNDTTPTINGTAEPGSTVTLYDTNGTTVLGMTTTDSAGNWSITSSILGTGTHTFTVKVTDPAGNISTASTATVTVDTTAPAQPVITSMISATNNPTPTINGTAEPGSTVTLYDTDGTTVLGMTTSDSAGNWSITSSILGTGTHTFTVKVMDTAGNVSTVSTTTVTVDTTVPTVSSHNPGTNATNVAVNAAIDITFSEPMNTMSITPASFTITPVNGSALSGTSVNHNSGNNESLTHPNLAYGTTYTVKLANTVTDAAGNALTTTSWNFTTVQQYTVGGTVTGLPASTSVVLQNNGADNLTVSANRTFTFTTNMTDGAAYAVTIQTQPAGKTCTVINGSGSISGANVTNVSVVCHVVVPLNDTGITAWGDINNNSLTSTQSSFPGQDADSGRDAQAKAGTLNKTGASSKANQGFDFTKLDNTGSSLSNQAVVYTTTPWDCVKDNHTGLMWEVKTTDNTIRDKSATFTWYNSNMTTNGGNTGTANGGSCNSPGNCDTEKYIAAVNNGTGICGFHDWRLPTLDELNSIVDRSVPNPGPTIDTGYFPNTQNNTLYWTSSPYSVTAFPQAWYVEFQMGFSGKFSMNSGSLASVRLVRGGQ